MATPLTYDPKAHAASSIYGFTVEGSEAVHGVHRLKQQKDSVFLWTGRTGPLSVFNGPEENT